MLFIFCLCFCLKRYFCISFHFLTQWLFRNILFNFYVFWRFLKFLSYLFLSYHCDWILDIDVCTHFLRLVSWLYKCCLLESAQYTVEQRAFTSVEWIAVCVSVRSLVHVWCLLTDFSACTIYRWLKIRHWTHFATLYCRLINICCISAPSSRKSIMNSNSKGNRLPGFMIPISYFIGFLIKCQSTLFKIYWCYLVKLIQYYYTLGLLNLEI